MSKSGVAYHPMEVAASPDTIHTGPCKLHGFTVQTDGTADVTVIIKDGASGDEVITYIVTGTLDSKDVPFHPPIQLTVGLEVSLSGTASRIVVRWSQ